MRIAAYIHSAFLPQGPLFNYGWYVILRDLLERISQANRDAQCFLISGSRFVQHAASFGPPVGDRVKVLELDDVRLHRRLASRGITPSGLSRLLYEAERGSPALQILMDEIRSATKSYGFDIILSFATPTDFLEEVFPTAFRLHVKAGAFSRNPYPFSLFFDHLGMYRWSVMGQHGDAIGQREISSDCASLTRHFKQHYLDVLSSINPFGTFDFRQRFNRLCLLPLQVSNWYSFDEQTPYRTQFEFLLDVLCDAPADMGIIATEYVQWGEVLSRDALGASLLHLSSRFKNLIFQERFRHYQSTSQFLVPEVDAVWSATSNVGYQALLFDKPLGTLSGTHLTAFADA